MRTMSFSQWEVETFLKHFHRVPAWTAWERHEIDGRDVISVDVDGARPMRFRLAKTPSGCYAAKGFGDWDVVVCNAFETLLGSLETDTLAKAA